MQANKLTLTQISQHLTNKAKLTHSFIRSQRTVFSTTYKMDSYELRAS